MVEGGGREQQAATAGGGGVLQRFGVEGLHELPVEQGVQGYFAGQREGGAAHRRHGGRAEEVLAAHDAGARGGEVMDAVGCSVGLFPGRLGGAAGAHEHLGGRRRKRRRRWRRRGRVPQVVTLVVHQGVRQEMLQCLRHSLARSCCEEQGIVP
ncbi:hypothetical protein NHX12_010391 [Muraenolepis orangiensis]|uniref:Uncharacterized protein n=1 Tax=Muraenolepis orangiensis TaxID=630683 RepID=A0A9Q0DL33_9TELE|nr:hypothetical protein NHX12_010391 [Muraenolepis orangiensis]